MYHGDDIDYVRAYSCHRLFSIAFLAPANDLLRYMPYLTIWARSSLSNPNTAIQRRASNHTQMTNARPRLYEASAMSLHPPVGDKRLTAAGLTPFHAHQIKRPVLHVSIEAMGDPRLR